MIEIKVISEPYDYGNVGSKEYKTETNIRFNDDATFDQLVEGFMEAAKIAGYDSTGLPMAMRRLADEMEEDMKGTARIVMKRYGGETDG